MSRKGKIPVSIPPKVKVEVRDSTVFVEGPKGKLFEQFDANVVKVTHDPQFVVVEPANDTRLAGAMHGTLRSLIFNMIEGVQKPYSKDLEISGVGFKATLKGNFLDLILGYSHPVQYIIPAGILVTIQDGTKVHIEGASKKMVGQVAADIKRFYPVEPYKGKGVRIIGEYVRRKEGKKTA